MSACGELIDALTAGGMDAADAATLVARAMVEMAPPKDTRSSAAKRQAAYRERNKASLNVTHNKASQVVTNHNERDVSLRSDEKPPLILTSLPSTEETLKGKKEKIVVTRARPPKKQLGPLPDDWKPPDRAFALAKECGTEVSHVEPVFRDYLKSSGKLYADHDAAFCNFIRNQHKFSGQRANPHGRRTIQDAARDQHEKFLAKFQEPAPDSLCDGTREDAVRLLPTRRRE